MKLASGHTYEEMDAVKKKRYQKLHKGFINDMIYLNPGRWVVTKDYLKFQEKVYNFKFRKEDVVIMTYPKCGTTWMQEIIWTMLNNPNLDNPQADLPLFARSPFLESDMLFKLDPQGADEGFQKIIKAFQTMCPGKNPEDGLQVQLAEGLPGRRTIKTHFPFSLLSPDLLSTAKVIFVARNPKDACLSFQHHHRVMKPHSFVGTQDEFIGQFVDGELVFGHFHAMVKKGWTKRDHPNMHFVFFEDLKADIDGELKKINDFIGAGLTEQQLKNVKEYTSFGKMRDRDPMNPEKDGGKTLNMDLAKKEGGFFRKGEAGSWKGKMTPEQEAKIDDYTKKHFEGTGLTFKF